MSDSIEKIADEMRTRYGACPATIAAHAVDVAAMLTRWADRLDSLRQVPEVCDEALRIMDGVVTIVERWPVRWAAEGSRLKDQRQWVEFYNLVSRLKDGRDATLANPAPTTSGNETLTCKACGEPWPDYLLTHSVCIKCRKRQATPAQAGAELPELDTARLDWMISRGANLASGAVVRQGAGLWQVQDAGSGHGLTGPHKNPRDAIDEARRGGSDG